MSYDKDNKFVSDLNGDKLIKTNENHKRINLDEVVEDEFHMSVKKKQCVDEKSNSYSSTNRQNLNENI